MQSATCLFRSLAPCLIVAALPLLAVEANEGPANTPAHMATEDSAKVQAAEAEAQAQMDEAKIEVFERVGISAPMDLEMIHGVDSVEEARKLGLIVDVTLEEVEAALADAATTPEVEDDIEALRLKHFGSYPFLFTRQLKIDWLLVCINTLNIIYQYETIIPSPSEAFPHRLRYDSWGARPCCLDASFQ